MILWACRVARIANEIPDDGNVHAIGVILMGFEFSHNFYVGDLLEPIGGYVLIVDD